MRYKYVAQAGAKAVHQFEALWLHHCAIPAVAEMVIRNGSACE
jgi:hypothetical protein